MIYIKRQLWSKKYSQNIPFYTQGTSKRIAQQERKKLDNSISAPVKITHTKLKCGDTHPWQQRPNGEPRISPYTRLQGDKYHLLSPLLGGVRKGQVESPGSPQAGKCPTLSITFPHKQNLDRLSGKPRLLCLFDSSEESLPFPSKAVLEETQEESGLRASLRGKNITLKVQTDAG